LSVYRIIIGRDASGKEMVIQKRAHRCLTGEGDKKTGPCLVKDRAPEDSRRMGGKLQEALPFKGADPRKASVPAGKLKLRRIGRGPGRRVMSHAGKKVLSHGRDLIRPSERGLDRLDWQKGYVAQAERRHNPDKTKNNVNIRKNDRKEANLVMSLYCQFQCIIYSLKSVTHPEEALRVSSFQSFYEICMIPLSRGGIRNRNAGTYF
jgi:hypothetical protein